MRIFFLGKRHYTNQDAIAQQFGRMYRLPQAWHRDRHHVSAALLDYHGYRRDAIARDGFSVRSLPAVDPRSIIQLDAVVKSTSPEVLVASGDCFIGHLGMRLARRSRARFVFDVYDDYRTFGAYRAFLGWDALGFLCARAALVTYASASMAEEHRFDTPCVVVPNGVDAAVFRPVPTPEARQRLQLPAAGRLVGYFGSMTAEHGVNELIQAVRTLRARGTDVQLLVCGKEHPATSVSGGGVRYRGMVPHSSIPDYLNACDVLALPYLNGAFLDKASSCKIAEYLFCERPIVATRTPNFVQNFPEQARQLDSLLVPPGDVDALAHSIQRQLEHPLIADPPADMTWPRIAAGLIPRFRQLLG